jgi:flagellar basal-body rod protein FlgB
MLNFSSQVDLLQRLMLTAEVRQKVLSQNLANVNTPGYHRLDISFDQELERQMQGQSGGPQMYEEQGLMVRADGNNVDVDQELGHLNQNVLIHEACTQLLSNQMSQLRRAMS